MASDLETAARHERARISAWLREMARDKAAWPESHRVFTMIAAKIEAGDHRR